MITKQFLKISLLYVNIINILEIILKCFIFPNLRINEVRMQNLYNAFCKHQL